MTAYAGIAASTAAALLVLAAPWHWMSLTGSLLLAAVPGGAAVMCWVDSGEDGAQAALTLVVSLAAFALASSIMIWAGAWNPRALLALAAASLVSCAARLRSGVQ
jgi:hypothetical protein